MGVSSERNEARVGFSILLVLVFIATWIFFKQFRYDESVINPSTSKEVIASASVSAGAQAPGVSDLQAYLPDGMKPLSPMETFEADTLSEKIDGKAELYLSAGFLNLRCQRFVKEKSPDSWLEFFLYDMGNMRNAFSVYSNQRRADAEKVDLTRFAYGTKNALFFVHGKEYVEIVAAKEDMAAEMLSMGRNFISKRPAGAEQVSELALFPSENLQEGSVSLLSTDVFGFQRLDNTFTATYVLPGGQVTAFLSLRKTPHEAEELTAAYHQFLMENGGKDLQPRFDIPGARFVEILDSFELIFNSGSLLAGVHEAEKRELAEEMALNLYKALKDASGETTAKQ